MQQTRKLPRSAPSATHFAAFPLLSQEVRAYLCCMMPSCHRMRLVKSLHIGCCSTNSHCMTGNHFLSPFWPNFLSCMPFFPALPPNSLPTHLSRDSTVCHATPVLLRDHGKGCISNAGLSAMPHQCCCAIMAKAASAMQGCLPCHTIAAA